MTEVKKAMGSEESKQGILYRSIREGRFPAGSVVKNLLTNAETRVRPLGSTPGFDPWVEKIPGKGNGNPLSILAWEIP